MGGYWRYEIAAAGWLVLSVGIGFGTVFFLVSSSGSIGIAASLLLSFVAMIVLVWIGRAVIQFHETRAWQAAGRRAQFTPADDGGRLRKPVLSTSIDGRTVRARAIEKGTRRGRPRGTVVETELRRPVEEGLVVTTAGSGWGRSAITPRLETDRASTADEELAAYGGPEPVARAVVSGRSRRTLLDVDGEVCVGDVSTAVSEGTSMSESPLWSLFEGLWTAGVPGDASTVSIRTQGVVLDGDRLERQATAVAAVADAYEEATSGFG